jgi:hypothetical protein
VHKWQTRPTLSSWLSFARYATLAGHSARFDRIDDRFSHLDKRFEDLEARHDLSEAWQRRMDERFAGIEARLAKIERSTDT